jgi:hypothetical protein
MTALRYQVQPHDPTAALLARLQRQVRLLQVYAAGLTLALALVVLCGAAAAPEKPKFAEIDVERINVVEKDGRLRLILTNQERSPDNIIEGKTFKPRHGPRPPGLYFFSDKGECGGLVFHTAEAGKDGTYSAGSALLFDQYRQDQTVGILYNDNNGERSAGLQVWDRPDSPLWKLAEKLAEIDKLPEGSEKKEAMKKLLAANPSATRVFVGKSRERSAVVLLADGKGRPRLRMAVAAEGGATIEFLDENGKVVHRLSPEENK